MYGAMPEILLEEKKYYVSFIDDYSKFTWIYLLKYKSKVFSIFKNFRNLLKDNLIEKFCQSKVTGEGSMRNSTLSSGALGLLIMCLALMHINRMALLSANIAT